MTSHAKMRAFEYYGVKLEEADQQDILARIGADEGACLREWSVRKRHKLPIYLIHWPRIAKTIAVVVRTDFARIVTVLSPTCYEIGWRFEKLFGKIQPEQTGET